MILSQVSILGPILFNLCVSDISSIAPNNNCMQEADDSTLHRSCKLKKKDTFNKELQNAINSHAKWSIKNNLLLNTDEAKLMLINQIFSRHKLKDEQFKSCYNNITLERISE